MANRPRGYGMTADIQNKMAAKYNGDMEVDARKWMAEVVGERLAPDEDEDTPLGGPKFCEMLKDGLYLGKLANTIMGEGTVKTTKLNSPFKQMENIEKFCTACKKYGMSADDVFQVVNLYEKQNPWSVVITLYALGRKAQANGYDGPVLGPRESTKNVRNFSDETLRASEGIISAQAGTNKVASQAGMSFGKGRFIADMKIDKAAKEGDGFIGLQAGTNQVATQSGMSFGAKRQINDPTAK